MKTLILTLSILSTQVLWAKQVSTDCPMMSERNSRSNPKISLKSPVKTSHQSAKKVSRR